MYQKVKEPPPPPLPTGCPIWPKRIGMEEGADFGSRDSWNGEVSLRCGLERHDDRKHEGDQNHRLVEGSPEMQTRIEGVVATIRNKNR